MSIYLSVDLDFFPYLGKKYQQDFFDHLKYYAKNKTLIVSAHQYLLPDVNKSKCNTLINIDFHSDLSETTTEFNCGTWINFVEWREQGIFKWIYSNKVCYETHGNNASHNFAHGSCWSNQKKNPFIYPKNTEWKSVSRKLYKPSLIDWKNITKVGIAASPNWIHGSEIKIIQPYCELFKIPRKWYGFNSKHEDKIRTQLYY